MLIGLLITGSDSGRCSDGEFEIGTRALSDGNYAEAYCRWKPLAEKGNADAQYHLGWLYANGNGMAVDIGQALEWWGAAARQGHADAQFALGLAYTTGEGIGKDLREAVRWYLAAARQGHQDARDILVRINGDPAVRLLEWYPGLVGEAWFGWNAVVAGDGINLRAGPGTDRDKVAQLGRGTELRVIGSRGDWYMVAWPSAAAAGVAWIYKSLVRRAGR